MTPTEQVIAAAPAHSRAKMMESEDTAARVRLPKRTLMDRRGIVARASRQTLTSFANEGAGCNETPAGSRTTRSPSSLALR